MNRAQLINNLEDIIDMVKESSEKDIEPIYFIPDCNDLSEEEKSENEYDKLGFFVSNHPLDKFRIKLSELKPISSLADEEDGIVNIGGLLMNPSERVTKKGTKMGIFTLEDLSGRIEVLMFGKSYEQNKRFLQGKNTPVLVNGRLSIEIREMDDGTEIRIPKIVLNKISELEESERIQKLTLSLTKNDDIYKIKKLLDNYPGEIKIDLEYEHILFQTDMTLRQDRSVLIELSSLCHYERKAA